METCKTTRPVYSLAPVTRSRAVCLADAWPTLPPRSFVKRAESVAAAGIRPFDPLLNGR